jgi:flavorubredoxin
MEALVVYWSKTGNTKKVAFAIKEGLEEAGAKVTFKTTDEVNDIDWFDYDLVCIGCPSHSWRPPKPVDKMLRSKHSKYNKEGYVRPGSPKIEGKNALIFCTYSGPHTGTGEAIPTTKIVGQYFDHLGFTILDEWHILSELHGSEELSTKGRMGNTKGLPSEDDLKKIKREILDLVKKI